MLQRKLLWLGAVACTIVGLVEACGTDVTDTAATVDSGAPGVLGESVCPDAAPDRGEGCLQPEGTTCAFGACGTSIAQCVAGAWRFAGNPTDAAAACPVDFPASESACPPCFPPDGQCVYGSVDCTTADASANTSVATCPNGRWAIASFPCRPDAGSGDSGSYVQGDADADAD